MIAFNDEAPDGSRVRAIVSSGDVVDGITFQGIPDGVGMRPGDAPGTVEVYVAHEETTVPFFGSADFQDASISHLTLSTRGGMRGAVLAADFRQQREVGHISGPHPENVGIGSHQLDISRVEHLRDEGHIELFSSLGHQLETLLAQPLERIGRGARFESVTAENMGACSLDRFGGTEELLATLNGTGAGHYRERPAPDARSPHLDNGVAFPKVPAHEFEGFENRHRSLDTGQRFPRQLLDTVAIANRAYDGVRLTNRNMSLGPN